MKKHFFDAAVCAAVIFTAALLIVCPQFFKTKDSPELYVEISVNGQSEKSLPLSKDAEYLCSNGVTVTVENGAARISFSDCRDKLCMHNTKLNKNGETAVCLPNKTVVTVHGDQTEVDGIVG